LNEFNHLLTFIERNLLVNRNDFVKNELEVLLMYRSKSKHPRTLRTRAWAIRYRQTKSRLKRLVACWLYRILA